MSATHFFVALACIPLAPKRVDLLKEAVPSISKVAVLSNADHAGDVSELRAQYLLCRSASSSILVKSICTIICESDLAALDDRPRCEQVKLQRKQARKLSFRRSSSAPAQRIAEARGQRRGEMVGALPR